MLWKKLVSLSLKGLSFLGLLFIGIYRSIGTNHLGGSCRFEPSCSCYANQALREFSFFRAIFLITKRVSKCHPWGPFGFDPLPRSTKQES